MGKRRREISTPIIPLPPPKDLDPIVLRWPWPIPPVCHLPAVWELLIHRDILVSDDPIPLVVGDEPMPIKEKMSKYFEARIELINNLIKQKKLDSKIGNMAIEHFRTHLKELEELGPIS